MEDDEVKKFLAAYKTRHNHDLSFAEFFDCHECGFGLEVLKQILELAKELK